MTVARSAPAEPWVWLSISRQSGDRGGKPGHDKSMDHPSASACVSQGLGNLVYSFCFQESKNESKV